MIIMNKRANSFYISVIERSRNVLQKRDYSNMKKITSKKCFFRYYIHGELYVAVSNL